MSQTNASIAHAMLSVRQHAVGRASSAYAIHRNAMDERDRRNRGEFPTIMDNLHNFKYVIMTYLFGAIAVGMVGYAAHMGMIHPYVVISLFTITMMAAAFAALTVVLYHLFY